jgi:hypothetical protein
VNYCHKILHEYLSLPFYLLFSMFIAKLKYASVINVNLSNELNDDHDELNVHDVIINDVITSDVNLIHDVLYVQVNEVQI